VHLFVIDQLCDFLTEHIIDSETHDRWLAEREFNRGARVERIWIILAQRIRVRFRLAELKKFGCLRIRRSRIQMEKSNFFLASLDRIKPDHILVNWRSVEKFSAESVVNTA